MQTGNITNTCLSPVKAETCLSLSLRSVLNVALAMDPLYEAVLHFRHRKFDECITVCTTLLEKNPLDQVVWVLKMQALTQQVYVDDLEALEQGIAEMFLDDNSVAQIPRPGTSLRTPTANARLNSSLQSRPRTQSGRPLSGVVRLNTGTARPGSSMERVLKTARTLQTARPTTSSTGRWTRIGTASMLSQPDGPFINTARLNLTKYAKEPAIAKPLFEYLYYYENDVRKALDLASVATQQVDFKEAWWKTQLGRCYLRLNLVRDAEQQLKSSLQQQIHTEAILLLAYTYVRLDQPLAAMDVYKKGLERFPAEVALLTGLARIQEGLHEMESSFKFYKEVLVYEAANVEAIACIATHHFYNDQPELAMTYYRRLLQMGVHTAEVFTNLGLCCFFSQQYDLALPCFQQALSVADNEQLGDVWYNIGHVALSVGDTTLAKQCWQLSLVYNHDHAEAYNNLGVLAVRKGKMEEGRAFFQAAVILGAHLVEPFWNYSRLAEQDGDVQTCFTLIEKALSAYPGHLECNKLMDSLKSKLAAA